MPVLSDSHASGGYRQARCSAEPRCLVLSHAFDGIANPSYTDRRINSQTELRRRSSREMRNPLCAPTTKLDGVRSLAAVGRRAGLKLLPRKPSSLCSKIHPARVNGARCSVGCINAVSLIPRERRPRLQHKKNCGRERRAKEPTSGHHHREA